MLDRKNAGVLALTGAGLSILFRMGFTVLGIDGYREVEQKLIADKGLLLPVIELVLISPIVEELIFRYVLYGSLKKWMSVSMAMILSSLLFGIYHWNIPQGIYAFVMGLLLAGAMEWYQTLKAPVVVHMAANAAALFIRFSNL